MIDVIRHTTKSPAVPTVLPVWIQTDELKLVVIGGGQQACELISLLISRYKMSAISVIAPTVSDKIKALATQHKQLQVEERDHLASDLEGVQLLLAATDNAELNEEIKHQASLFNILTHVAGAPELSDFSLNDTHDPSSLPTTSFLQKLHNGELHWKNLATYFIIAFSLMVIGHIIISYLPLPPIADVWTGVKPHLTGRFFLFVLAGFLAQMVDGMLSMGYGVTSATCLISAGVNPVSVSAAIHTSEIFTTGISGFSHYRFKNVNKKLFKHLVIPGVIGAVLGAIALVYIGEKAGKYLMPIIALYAMFLGVKILMKAFQLQKKTVKVKRVGWLAWVGGFLDSFGGGGWGPIVTSTLISKGKNPRYTVGTVSLTEFFVTFSSAFTFFFTVGISHWNVVLGLLIGGSIAAPFAARLAGKLPRKTMMIAVGVMVIIWCIRMIIKSFA
ncbi:TSUP family transporter [Aridibaculum aurantiacum]|uniref:TSUP family transporter n=1 Tax=Aridibaculum aurantiacum TaxID=2810307 RepID=UPI001A96BC99|nr:TSUP family transporter [Aridibaculum aurantiacum]